MLQLIRDVLGKEREKVVACTLCRTWYPLAAFAFAAEAGVDKIDDGEGQNSSSNGGEYAPFQPDRSGVSLEVKP